MTSVSFEQAPAWVAEQLAAGGPGTRWVGVDGLGAAGKSTLAARIAAALPGSVLLPIDHFGRAALRDWDRDLFVAQVVEPLLAGRPGRYRRWDLVADRGLDWVDVPVGVPVVVEGVSSTDVRLPVPWDLRLWVDASEDVRRARIADRDPPELLARWAADWWPSEQEYVDAQDPRTRADAVVSSD
ncbi:uridine kinase family protein [Microlunatus ginsengisoli]|uniref:AAA family ATPase n=1 Tax=Microlunatus ginsengisoli TaxID=363863 RepID=A0ABP6ZE02_9ACTN